jgi:6-phosphogluconolactonase
MTTDFKVFADLEALSLAAADLVAGAAKEAVDRRGRFSLALSGGHTPRRLYQLLAEKGELPWDRVHCFWGDERCVGPDDPASNYRMAADALLTKIPIPDVNVHRILGEKAPDEAAEAYEADLRRFFAGAPAFDVLLLGVGDDGHTASLFPASEALDERRRWVLPVRAPAGVEPQRRITLTLPVLNAARRVFFLAAGVKKAPIVKAIMAGPRSAGLAYPAARVDTAGEVLWLLDRHAAS